MNQRLLFLVLFLVQSASSFTLSPRAQQPNIFKTSLSAQKKRSRSEGKGFGTKPIQSKTEKKVTKSPSSSVSQIADSKPFLQGIETGGSNSVPILEEEDDNSKNQSLSPDERAERILREKYGMKTLEEQQLSQKQLENLNEQRRKLQELKRKAELNEDIDIIALIPGPVQIVIDRFLKVGLGISGK